MATITTDIDTATVQLVGPTEVAAKWGVDRDMAYSAKRRLKWGPPDWIASGAHVWLADRFGDKPREVDLTPIDRDALPPLLGLEELAICFGVAYSTMANMRKRLRQDVKPPQPYTLIGGKPVWWAPAWTDYVRITGRKFDLNRLPPQSQRPGFIPYPDS